MIPAPRWSRFGAVLAVCAFALLCAPAAWAKKDHKVPRTLKLEGQALSLNGAAIQTWWFWDIYTVALYLESPTKDLETVLDSEQHKVLHLRLLRGVSQEKLRSALMEGFRKNNPGVNGMDAELRALWEAIPEGHKGDDIYISYVPGRGIRVQRPGGDSVDIPGKAFARALFRIWLGPDAGVEKVKKGLLAGPDAMLERARGN